MGSPKFPSSLPLELLLTGGERHRAHALKTLDAICSSGIYDHVGGGLHRYAVDAEWDVPHFEKMLYDNALLLRHMHQADSSRYQHFIRETTEFLFRELRDSDTGLFYSAIDAESDDPTGGSAEGYYYTWTNEELSQLLTDKEVCELSLVEFEERNIIVNCKREYKEKLLNVRSSRAYPFVDKKVICSWNSLLVDALAPIETDKAKKTLDALFQYLVEDGELYRVASKELAHFEDYAYLVRACISVYQHSKEECYLSHAMRLSKELEEFFLSDNGGFYSSRQSPDSPPFREISCFDNSLPSGNGIHCLNLLKLFALTRENNYQDRALGVLLAFSEELEKFPQASGALSLAFHAYKKDIASVRSGNVELWETARSFAGPFNVFTFDESVRGAEVCYSDRCILSTTSSTELAECLRSI